MIMTPHIRGGAAVNNEEKILSILSVMQEKISAMEGSISTMEGSISTMQGDISSCCVTRRKTSSGQVFVQVPHPVQAAGSML